MFYEQSIRWLTVPGVLLLTAAPLSAGVVYQIEGTGHEQSAAESIEISVEGRNLRMGAETKGSRDEGELIFRGDRREMVFIDHETRSYQVVDDATMGQVAGKIDDMMQEALKDVPADQRAMVEQMMKQRMQSQPAPKRARPEIKNTGERAKKNGYPCVKYEIYNGRQKSVELWVTDWDNIEGGDEVVGAFEGMAGFVRDLMDAFPQMGQGGPGLDENIFEHLKELRGFPVVETRFAADGSVESVHTLRSARRQRLDDATFEPPAGYKRQEMPR